MPKGVYERTLKSLDRNSSKTAVFQRMKGKTRAKLLKNKVSDLEQITQHVLKQFRVPFETQKVISRMTVDIYIPFLKRVIEVDGKYWHEGNQAKADLVRDSVLRSLGYSVRRIKEVDVYDDPYRAVTRALKH